MEKSKYIVTINDSIPTIQLPDRVLGGSEAMEFSALTHKYLNDEAHNQIIIDLERVEVMNSSGLGMLVAAYTSATKQSKKIEFINIPDKIMKLLEMTHLNEIFFK